MTIQFFGYTLTINKTTAKEEVVVNIDTAAKNREVAEVLNNYDLDKIKELAGWKR